jgi:hypothetical protein
MERHWEHYAYDTCGRRTHEKDRLRDSRGRTRLYLNDSDQLTAAGNVSFTYNTDGYLTTKNVGGLTTTYEYSILGELKKVEIPQSGGGTKIIEYQHDAQGRPVARKVKEVGESVGSIKEKYLWAGSTTLLATYNASDELTRRFLLCGGRLPVAMDYAGIDITSATIRLVRCVC